MRSLILDLLLLLLGVLFDPTLDCINKSPRVSEILSKKSLEFDSRQRSYSLALNPALMLVPTETEPTREE